MPSHSPRGALGGFSLLVADSDAALVAPVRWPVWAGFIRHDWAKAIALLLTFLQVALEANLPGASGGGGINMRAMIGVYMRI